MKRTLIRSNAFIRAAKQLLRKNPQLAGDIQTALVLLSEDAFNPKLKTHKLKGCLEGSWACSGGYDLRIIFEFVRLDGSEASVARMKRSGIRETITRKSGFNFVTSELLKPP